MVCPIKEKDKRMYCLLNKYYGSKKIILDKLLSIRFI
tara:strand:- start:311 stop:421 length:111 start_codon:yes stop_codon:yes gene_type:complete